MNTDWKEDWVDQMGLIGALSGTDRFNRLQEFKSRLTILSEERQSELMRYLALRFTPSSVKSDSSEFNGCRSGTEAIEEAVK